MTSLCLADFEDAAYIIAVLVFTVLSWIVGFIKKRAQEKEEAAKPSSDEMFEQAELIEEEPVAQPKPMRSFKLHLADPANPRVPPPPPVAKPTGFTPNHMAARTARMAHASLPPTQVPPLSRSEHDQARVSNMPGGEIVSSILDAIKTASTATPPVTAKATPQTPSQPKSPSPLLSPSPSVPTISSPLDSRPARGGAQWAKGLQNINAVRRAIVMAEVLGPPVAFREPGRCPGDSDSTAP